jgi:hypothetical protein
VNLALETAIKAWQDELGLEYVDIGTDSLSRVAEATFKIERQVLAILKPKRQRAGASLYAHCQSLQGAGLCRQYR